MSDISIGSDRTMGPGASGPESLPPGTALGQYRIIRLLGRGGMGEVYLAEHGIMRQNYALKVLPAALTGEPGFLERFRREAEVMARLRHPGIVPVHYADVQDGICFIAMDAVLAGDDKHTLQDALEAHGAQPEARVRRLALAICDAVAYAHGCGVIHRDLKPGNVLLTSRDLDRAEARVTDFGLARLIGEDWLHTRVRSTVLQSAASGQSSGADDTDAPPGSTSARALLGTYDYMSPEQRDGEPADERSDIYAIGVMLYRMLTGKRLMGRAKAASDVVSGLSPGWDDLIDACLEEDRTRRPQSVASVMDRLQALGGGAQRAAPGVTTPQRAAAGKGGRRLWVGVLVTTALAVGAGVAVLRVTRERQAERVAPAPSSAGAPVEKEVQVRPAAAPGESEQPLPVELPEPEGTQPPAMPKQDVPEVPAAKEATAEAQVPTTPEPVAEPAPPPEPVAEPTPAAEPDAPQVSEPERPPPKSLPLDDHVSMELLWIPELKLWMGKYEVTADQYRAFLQQSGYKGTADADGNYLRHFAGGAPRWGKVDTPSDDGYPIVWISWNNAARFCEWLASKSGSGVRLPTETEWETACRGRSRTRFHWGDDPSQAVNYAWFSGDTGSLQPVGKKEPNAYGLHDMAGNAWEFCMGWFDAYQNSRPLRGGSWYKGHEYLEAGARMPYNPARTWDNVGFRVVVEE